MKNKWVFLLATLAIAAVAFTAGGGETASAVPIPDKIISWGSMLIFAAVTAGFKFVFEKLRLDFRGYATEIAGSLSAWIFLELQGLVNLIPEAYDTYVTIGFEIVIVVIGGLGTLFVIKKFRPNDSNPPSLL